MRGRGIGLHSVVVWIIGQTGQPGEIGGRPRACTHSNQLPQGFTGTKVGEFRVTPFNSWWVVGGTPLSLSAFQTKMQAISVFEVHNTAVGKKR